MPLNAAIATLHQQASKYLSFPCGRIQSDANELSKYHCTSVLSQLRAYAFTTLSAPPAFLENSS